MKIKERAKISSVFGAAVAALFLFAACAVSDTASVIINGSGFYQHDGNAVYANLINSESAANVGETSATISNGSFSMTLANVVQNDNFYALNFFIDDNPEDGFCFPPEDAWSTVVIGLLGLDSTVTTVHNVDAIHGLTGTACLTFQ